MNTLYFTQNGYDSFLKRLDAKKAEHLQVQKERAEALQETSESDMNDPVLVDLQQRESSLNFALVEMEKILVHSQLVQVDPNNRNTDQVQIGSLLEIIRTNVTTGQDQPLEIWEIAGYDETDIKQRLLSYNSPIGKSLIGASKGEVITDVKIGEHEFEIEVIQLYKSWTEV